MTEREQTDRFCDELDRLVERFRAEYDMSYAAVVGSLAIKAHMLMAEAEKLGDEEADTGT